MFPKFLRTNHLAAATVAACLACSASSALAVHSVFRAIPRPDHCQLMAFLLHSPARQVIADLAKNAILSLGEAKISNLLQCLSGLRLDAALWLVSNVAHSLHTVLSQVFCWG
jgi:hypothetical protein